MVYHHFETVNYLIHSFEAYYQKTPKSVLHTYSNAIKHKYRYKLMSVHIANALGN